MKQNNRYVIDKRTYEKHIDDEVHLYGMLHQLAFLAERVKDAEDMANIIDTAQCYGKTADGLFDGWDIPGRYLVFGEKKDLADLKDKELEKLADVLAEHDAEALSAALEQASWNLPYLIHGSSFRLLVGSIFELLARYSSLERKVMHTHTEKDLARLQKKLSDNGNMVRHLRRGWGVPQEQDVTAHDVLERAILEKHLIPVRVEPTDGYEETEDLAALLDFFGEGSDE